MLCDKEADKESKESAEQEVAENVDHGRMIQLAVSGLYGWINRENYLENTIYCILYVGEKG
jgi:hypothetical protein